MYVTTKNTFAETCETDGSHAKVSGLLEPVDWSVVQFLDRKTYITHFHNLYLHDRNLLELFTAYLLQTCSPFTRLLNFEFIDIPSGQEISHLKWKGK